MRVLEGIDADDNGIFPKIEANFKVKIYDEDGNDVSRNYMIIYDYGYLTVYFPSEGGQTNSSKIYVRGSRNDVVYLRQKKKEFILLDSYKNCDD